MTLIQSEIIPVSGKHLLAEDEAGAEYINGQITEKSVSNISSFVARRIGQLLGVEADKSGSAWVFDGSIGYQCFPDEPEKYRKPDTSVVLTERLKDLPPEFGLMPLPADLAVEVNSPNALVSKVEEKVDEYLAAGFRVVWIVDPPSKTVTIHRIDGSLTRLHEHQEITGETALPTFKCQVAEFFRKPGE